MNRIFSVSVLLPVIVVLAVLFGLWGWAAQQEALGITTIDVIMRALGSLVMSTAYETGGNVIKDWRLDAARVLGAIAFVMAATKAVSQLLSESASRYFGRFRQGHLLIVGDHPVARASVEGAAVRGLKSTWITGSETMVGPIRGALIVPRPWDASLAEQFAAGRAIHILVALTDEVRQIAAVRALRSFAPGTPLSMHFGDPWFGERMDELENISNVRYVSSTQVSLRQLHWKHPPFLIAERLGQSRLHALLIGFGRGGEAVLHDILLSSITSFQGRPRITIVDPKATEILASLNQRAPELSASAEVVVLDAPFASDARILPAAALAQAQSECPFTLAYVCLDSDLRALAAAVSLQAFARREGWSLETICTRLGASGALPETLAGWDNGLSVGLLAFGATQDFAESIGLYDSRAETLPRLLHEAYRRVAPDHAVANLPWEGLSEELRDSNRRLLMHLPAKLASSGLDVAAWLASRTSTNPWGHGLDLPDLAESPALLEQLAALEHERWMAERRLSGWHWGPERDNGRHIHPDLVPYAKLGEGGRRFAREMVVATFDAVRQTG